MGESATGDRHVGSGFHQDDVLILSLFLLAIITWRAYREYARGQPRRTFGHKPFDLIIVGSGAAAFGAAIKVNDLRSVHAVAQSTAVVLDTIGATGQTVAARPVPHGSALLMNPAHVHLMLNHFSIIGSIFGLVLLAVAMVRNSRELITVSLACLASVAIISVAALLANNRSSFRRVVFTLQHAAAIRDHAYC